MILVGQMHRLCMHMLYVSDGLMVGQYGLPDAEMYFTLGWTDQMGEQVVK